MATEEPKQRRREIWHHVWSVAATAGVGVLVIVLLTPPRSETPTPRDADSEASAPVRVTAHATLAIAPGTPLWKKLEFTIVSAETVTAPILSTTGAVVARHAVGAGTLTIPLPSTRPTTASTEPASTHPAVAVAAWDFGSPDLFSNYTDWVKSQDDVRFNLEEVAKIRKMNEAKLTDLKETETRLDKLVKAGSDAPKDLQVARSARIQGEIQAEKDMIEAEQALRVAIKTQSTLERQLIAADVPPDLLTSAEEGTVLVAADVPESLVPLIHVGDACQARFYGLPNVTFPPGRIRRIGSMVVKDRRTLRVLFVIQDPENRLHSNMFAEVDLGTGGHNAIAVPVNALLHDGSSDYVLVKTGPGTYAATEVKTGGPAIGGRVEVRTGLKDGNEIISTGAILLKPYLVQSLEEVK